MSPKITIGISFKNPGHHFPLALQSVFAQTFTDWELILTDDGSTDNSLALANRLNDSRVRVYSDGVSKGLNIRLNQQIALAQAPYFVRMDADDVMHPHRLVTQYEHLIAHDQNTVIGSSAYSIDARSQVVGFRLARQQQKSGFDARHSFIHPTVAASIEWFRHNPYSESFIFQRSQDAELWYRTTHQTRFVNISESLLYYRESGVFSFSNYLGTSLGLLHLIHHQFSASRWQYLVLFWQELAKLGVAAVLDHFGMADCLVSKRYQKMDEPSLAVANAALAVVQQQALPLSANDLAVINFKIDHPDHRPLTSLS